ncbi:MAG: acyl-CoA thioesterase [Candidatus Omnitrophica bacterium]|nr:acyl-CoA thioesterase [Candidatus Omnitrophota bacterium]
MNNFYIERKIYYHDTDCGGVVYYANYLKHLEEARTEYCLKRGINLKELSESGTYFVVAHVDLDYKAPAHYQDKIRITAQIQKIGSASLFFLQQIFKDDLLLLEAKTTWVCVGGDFKPKQIPPEIKRVLTA